MHKTNHKWILKDKTFENSNVKVLDDHIWNNIITTNYKKYITLIWLH
jgi:hypothetical protein